MALRSVQGCARRAFTIVSVALVTCFVAAPAMAAKSDKSKKPKVIESVPGQFLVQLKNQNLIFETKNLEMNLGVKVIDRVQDDVILVQRDKREPRRNALATLNENPYVSLAEPNFIYRASKVPNDPEYKKLWGMSNAGGVDTEGTRGLMGVDIGAEKAWDITTGSKSVVLAVIDTGIDFKIADLAPNAWTNQAELNGKAGVDDDGNGYVDDIHGYDFANNDGDATDDNGHGSHCAGTIGASGDDANGVAGVNWNVSLMHVKFLDAGGSGSLANAVKSIDYARKNGARIMSNSWGGGGFSAILEKSIKASRDADILFLAAAGNDGSNNDLSPSYPSSYDVDNVIAVAAVDARGDLADFSNFGVTSVDIAAPGVNIVSTTPTGLDSYSGTSMATPHVAGVAALVLSTDEKQTYAQLKERLLNSTRPVRGLKGKVATGGMLNAYYALSGETPPADPYDPSVWVESQAYQLATPHPYADEFEITYTVTIPGARQLSVKFTKFETEAGYDFVKFVNPAGESLGTWSGNHDGDYSPIVDGDTIIMKFKADDSVNAYGFEVESVVYEK